MARGPRVVTMYTEADSETYDLMRSLIDEFRNDLAEVEIRILFAFNPRRSPLTHNGWVANAVARINSAKDRADGKKDCTIYLDKSVWETLTDRRRQALLHHELHHFINTGDADAVGRPVIKIRKHDWQFGGFDDIMATYGDDSYECRFADMLAERRRQKTLPGVMVDTPAAGQEDDGGVEGDKPKGRRKAAKV